jgi:hypothetical protein
MKALAKVKIGVLRKEIHKMATKSKVRRKGSTRKIYNVIFLSKIYNVIIFRSGVTLQLNANLKKVPREKSDEAQFVHENDGYDLGGVMVMAVIKKDED